MISIFAPSEPRPASSAGITSRPTIKIGPRIVIATNHFVRTRSRNSRFAITRVSRMVSLRAAFGDRGRGPDLGDEDLVKRRRHDLEAAQPDARVDQRGEQLLRIGALGELALAVGDIAGPRRPLLAHELLVGKHALGGRARVVIREAERDHALGRRGALAVLELAVEDLLAARDDAA